MTNVASAPFTGPKAVAVAQPILQREAVQKALGDELKKIKAEEKGKIVYAKGYEPAATASKGTTAGGATPVVGTAPAGAVPAAGAAAASNAPATAAPSN